MIVHPHFFDHWKTKALIELTNKPEAPLWLQRLWGHCQSTQTVTFRLPTIALKSICGVTADITPDRWFTVLVECRFIDGTPEKWTVHEWSEVNAKLVANWKNGKKEKNKPRGSHAEATRKPPASHHGANGKPNPSWGLRLDGLDRIGLDGLDQKDKKDQKEENKPNRARVRAASRLPADEPDLIRNRMIACNALDHRRNTTRWPEKEFEAFKAAGIPDLPEEVWSEQIGEMSLYYGAPAGRIGEFENAPGKDFRRRNMATLLNNWAGEVDRARKFASWLKEKNDRDNAGRV